MNTRIRSHFLTRLHAVVVLSAMITTYSASAMLIPDTQQVNPPLAHVQDVMKKANEFLDIKEKPRNKRLDEAQVKLYAALMSGGTAALSGALWFARCAGICDTEINLLFLFSPAVVGLLSYLYFNQGTTLSCFRDAVLQVSPVIKALHNDEFFNGSITDQELDAYVDMHFDVKQGVLGVIQNYRKQYEQLKATDKMLQEVACTKDPVLAQQCADLQEVVSSTSRQLIGKVAALKANLKEQLKQQRKATEKEKRGKAIEQENDRLKQEQKRLTEELQKERDRSVAIPCNVDLQKDTELSDV